MTSKDRGDYAQNRLVGNANYVVQAGQVHGGVHIHQRNPKGMDAALRELADAVRAQWLDEAARRSLLDPAPLAVSWIASPLHADHPGNIRGSFSGRSNDPRQLVRSFRMLPHRRLVALGDGGTGKTTLAVLLLLAMLNDPVPAEPIPVVMPLASWEPHREHIHTWLSRRLEDDYPGLRRYGKIMIQRIVAERRIMPVLDGLDEIAPPLQSAALMALNRSLTIDDPLIVTCRTEAYSYAVRSGDVLRASAVVQAQPVSPDAIAEYLHSCTPPHRTQPWTTVFGQIKSWPNSPAAQALTTPLMVSLARTIYTYSSAPPTELLDTNRFPNRYALENFLLDSLLPTLYNNAPQPPIPERKPAIGKSYDTSEAAKWHAFLANHLYLLNTRDFAWWRLKHAVPAVVFGFLGWMSYTLLMLVVGLTLTYSEPTTNTYIILAVYGASGIILGVLCAIGSRQPDTPVRALIHSGRNASHVSRYALRVLAKSFTFIALLSFIFVRLGWPLSIHEITLSFSGDPAYAFGKIIIPLAVLSAVGRLLWIQVISTLWTLATEVDASTPRETLHSDRTVTILLWTTFVLIVTVFTLLTRSTLLTAIGIPLMSAWLLRSSWWNFLVARSWLAFRGKTPLRLMSFLEDAHKRGILLQSGGLYQFRHARVQDRLLFWSR